MRILMGVGVYFLFVLPLLVLPVWAQMMPYRMQIVDAEKPKPTATQVVSSSEPTSEAEQQEADSVEAFMATHPTLNDPILLKSMMASMRQLSAGIEQAHARVIDGILEEDTEARAAKQAEMKAQMPVQFNVKKSDEDVDYAKKIVDNPTEVMREMINSVQMNEWTDDTLQNQQRINQRLNEYSTIEKSRTP